MNVEQLYEMLSKLGNAEVRFQLPSGELIPKHFHLTEVGRVEKKFIDCGGTRRKATSCLLQTWYAEDYDHRLVASKFAKILKMAEPVLESLELPVEVEYGAEVASQYRLTGIDSQLTSVTLLLAGKQTDCLAKDKCGVSGCDPQSGCC